jgi:hypothetical protein
LEHTVSSEEHQNGTFEKTAMDNTVSPEKHHSGTFEKTVVFGTIEWPSDGGSLNPTLETGAAYERDAYISDYIDNDEDFPKHWVLVLTF